MARRPSDRPLLAKQRGAMAMAIALAITTMLGCGDDTSTDPDAPRQPVEATAPAAAERVARVEGGDVAALLSLLATPHAQARAAWGPHTLTWSAAFDLQGSSARVAEPALDAPVVDDHHIQDDGTLVWASDAQAPPRFSLTQRNDPERGRAVIAIGETMYVQMRHRAWVKQPFEPAAVQLWLDDAQHAAHDAIEFAAPRLAVVAQRASTGGIGDGPVLVLTLSLTETELALDADRPAAQGVRRGWRDEAERTGVAGTLTLDATTGLWLACDLDVQYALVGADERRLLGSLRLHATVKPGTAPVEPPATAEDLPELPRTAVEAQALLEGL